MSGVTSSVVADEEAFLARNPAVAEIHADAMRVGRESVLALIDAHNALRASDERRFNREVEELQRRSLVDYARRVHGLLVEPEVAPWRTKVDRLPAAARHDLLREVGVPGAVLLLDAMEPVPDPEPVTGSFDQALAAIADRCTCGLASSRAVPRVLCPLCEICVMQVWQAEEQRLLGLLPGLALELDPIFEVVLDEHADQENAPHEGSMYMTAASRRKAARKILRLNRAHHDQLLNMDMSHWRELAMLALLWTWPRARREAKRWKRCGLGTARLSAIALEGNPEVKARMKERARIR